MRAKARTHAATAIESVAEPEKAAREKQKKNDRKVVVRKQRAAEGRGKRRGW